MNTHTPNILLLDDDSAAHIYHRVMMEEAGLGEECAKEMHSVDDAILYLTTILDSGDITKLPSIIIADINMPVKSGWDFIDELKNLELNSSLLPKIFLVSNSENPADLEKAGSLPEVAAFKTKFLTKEFFEEISYSIN